MRTTLTKEYPADAQAVAFPLGGIGTGNVWLGRRGNLCDWEIFNHPGKGMVNPNSFFCLRVQVGNKAPVCRILEGPLPPPYTEAQGYQPFTAVGLPHFRSTRFFGEYPLAQVLFHDPAVPVEVGLEAFTPLIPLDADESGIPCAVLTYAVTNPGRETASISLVGSLMNPIGEIHVNTLGNIVPDDIGQNRNTYRQTGGVSGVFLSSERYQPGDLKFGNLGLATTFPSVTCKPAWLRSSWYDYLRDFWSDFCSDGRLDDLGYSAASPAGKADTASLGVVDTLEPGASGKYVFILAWYFPNRPKSWKPGSGQPLSRNHYACRFGSAWDVVEYVAREQSRLEEKTRAFHAALHHSTLPASVTDALSANIVPLRSTTCFWLEDGNFYGYEGCCVDAGSCAGNCTHVWSYAQTLAHLFPDLERNMRLTEFAVETEADGYMYFRAYRNFGETFDWMWPGQKPHPAIDGQMGSILRVYREWQIGGDRAWLGRVWPGVKRALEYVPKYWDEDGDGLPDGRQHNTYDIEFYGLNPLGAIYYLAALRAVEQLAEVMGEAEYAREVRQRFVAGSRRVDEQLWNGEYFVQALPDVDQYKYQFGSGCLSDQLLGQFYAYLLDLGPLLQADRVRSAVQSIFRHNFVRGFHTHENCQRTYVLGDESGVILCSWPAGQKPVQPFVYSDEVWTGVEYEVAALLIYEGFVEEGLEVVRAVRERQDGVKRNPWNEVECGNHYARSMASWAVMLAASGFHHDAARREVAFAPAFRSSEFRTLYTAGSGWGTYAQRVDGAQLSATLDVLHGALEIGELRLAVPRAPTAVEVRVGSDLLHTAWAWQTGSVSIQITPPVHLREPARLAVKVALAALAEGGATE